jgi:preprotein translocase subunit SecB
VAKDRLLSRVSFSLDIQQQGTPPLHCVTIKATIELAYSLTAEFEENELDCFARVNGIYHAWPYWREFVQNSTTRAGLPPLTLHPIQAGEALVMAGFPPATNEKKKAKANTR